MDKGILKLTQKEVVQFLVRIPKYPKYQLKSYYLLI
jgi:hypothetical protein